jgi:hypothetical protein
LPQLGKWRKPGCGCIAITVVVSLLGVPRRATAKGRIVIAAKTAIRLLAPSEPTIDHGPKATRVPASSAAAISDPAPTYA